MVENRSGEVRWETPVSDARSLAMVSLVDHRGLHITVQDLRDPMRRRICFSFDRVPAYRNILEEYRTSAPPCHQDLGWTRIDMTSAWLADLRSREPLLDVHTPGCQHYVIITEDDVVDVLAPEAPTIVEVSPAKADEAAPGKSLVFYHPEDREQIEARLGELGRLRENPKRAPGIDGGP
jgi:hypothetical protein